MKVPYYCPYCDQSSTRRWNLSTHIKRKHEGLSDPFESPDKIVLTNQHYQEDQPQSQPDFSNYSWPQIDWTNPIPFKDRSTNYENLLEQLRKLSKKEIIFLLYKIHNFPQLR